MTITAYLRTIENPAHRAVVEARIVAIECGPAARAARAALIDAEAAVAAAAWKVMVSSCPEAAARHAEAVRVATAAAKVAAEAGVTSTGLSAVGWDRLSA